MANSLSLLLVVVSCVVPPILSFSVSHRVLHLMIRLSPNKSAVCRARVCMAIKITITLLLVKTWVKIVHLLGVIKTMA